MSDRTLTAGWLRATPAPITEWHFFGPDNKIIGSVKDAGTGVFRLEAHGPTCDTRKRLLHCNWAHFGGDLEAAKNSVLDTLRDFGWNIEISVPTLDGRC